MEKNCCFWKGDVVTEACFMDNRRKWQEIRSEVISCLPEGCTKVTFRSRGRDYTLEKKEDGSWPCTAGPGTQKKTDIYHKPKVVLETERKAFEEFRSRSRRDRVKKYTPGL